MILAVAACVSARGDLLVEATGGEGTTTAANREAFGMSARNLTTDERRVFEVGDSFFTQNWVIAPSSTEARDGLGPLFNAQACASCHVRDGRGTPEEDQPGLLFRLGVPDGELSVPEPVYGDQLQDRSILGVPAEGRMVRLYVEEPGVFGDGEEYTLRRPMYEFEDLAHGSVSIDVQVSPRIAPPVFGVGLLEAIPEGDILAGSDPEDADGNGISGRPNWVTDPVSGEPALGRFGWKANVASVEHQVAGAFSGDIGITNPVFPDESCTDAETECSAALGGGDPEIPADRMEKVVFYSRTLAVPARRNLDSPDVVAGAGWFDDLGCSGCHQPVQQTGDDPIPALVNQTIYPFTDLLLHDMGPGLADNRPDGQASGTEWRTAPLWGIGLTETVTGHTFFLHDGRARSLEEAVLWHGGEAAAARDAFVALSSDQRSQLISFLESL
ncbi:MAG TPA: di-heme oxidoredictase family protein [Acidimicrobiia bacterium]|nr:di-heme oxidoredictase family protein [Acidimicrobiia bacterium]